MPAKKPAAADANGRDVSKLIRELRPFITDTVKTGSQALNEDRLLAYWEIGRRLKREGTLDRGRPYRSRF